MVTDMEMETVGFAGSAAGLTTTQRAYDVIARHTDYWKAHRNRAHERFSDAFIEDLLERFGMKLQSVFARAPHSELLPAVAQGLCDLLLLWIRDYQESITSSYGKKSKHTPPARRPRPRRKASSKQPRTFNNA
jgi:hypothetical protein